MHDVFQERYHGLEWDQWWFKARRDFIVRLVAGCGTDKSASILEVGCASGPLLAHLRQAGYGNVYGIDSSEVAIRRARELGLDRVALMDAARLTFERNCFDLVIASDVLEHIENDERAIREWVRVLKPDGYLLFFVPALRVFWSQHDEANRHFRRYSRADIRKLVAIAGLNVKRLGYWNFTLTGAGIIAAALRRIVPRRFRPFQPTGHLVKVPQILNEVLFNVILVENKLLRRLDFPVGTSLFAIAKKPAAGA